MGVSSVSFAEVAVASSVEPFWFLDRLDFQASEAVFVRTDRAALSDAVFLDPRFERQVMVQRRAPFSKLEPAPSLQRPPAIIWHTSFCCSTLIASCLDWPGVAMAVKEPGALVELSHAASMGELAATDALGKAVFSALARGVDPNERVVLKPSNGANGLIPVAGAMGAQMLMLYSSCRDFLSAVAWGGPITGGVEMRKSAARQLLAQRACGSNPTVRWSPAELCTLTDFQAAALLWHVQVAEMRAAAEALGPGQVRALDCELFLADPKGVLNDLDAFFDLDLGGARIAEVVAGPKLQRYAKKPDEVFDTARRNQIFKRVEQAMGATLDAIVDWSYQVCPETPRGNPIGKSVIGCGQVASSKPTAAQGGYVLR